MIKYLGIDQSPPAPWRCNDHRYPKTKSDRAWNIIFEFYMIQTGINTLGSFAAFRVIIIRCYEWRYVIKIAVILIISKNENGFLPNLRILRENVHYLRKIPGAKPWGARMVGKRFRRNQPGYGG